MKHVNIFNAMKLKIYKDIVQSLVMFIAAMYMHFMLLSN